MWVDLLPPELLWSEPPLPCAPHPGGGSSTPAPLPSSRASCCFVAKAKSGEQVSVVWSNLCTLIVPVLAISSCKTTQCMRWIICISFSLGPSKRIRKNFGPYGFWIDGAVSKMEAVSGKREQKAAGKKVLTSLCCILWGNKECLGSVPWK